MLELDDIKARAKEIAGRKKLWREIRSFARGKVENRIRHVFVF